MDVEGVGDGGCDLKESKREVREERKDRCRFQMSMKFEKIEVNAERFNRGSDVSREIIIGVRKCFRKVFSISSIAVT
jgi:hypothetical protein